MTPLTKAHAVTYLIPANREYIIPECPATACLKGRENNLPAGRQAGNKRVEVRNDPTGWVRWVACMHEIDHAYGALVEYMQPLA